jgi:hypothetical protein
VYRRRFLAAVPPVLAAGCLDTGAPERAGIGSLVVENRHERPHTAEVAVDREGDAVVSETFDLAANDAAAAAADDDEDDNDDDGPIPRDARESLGPAALPDERARYTVRVSLADAPAEQSHVIPEDDDDDDVGGGCYAVWFHVTGPETITPATNDSVGLCGGNNSDQPS